jgi:SAM-dependent methyltransferase
MDIQYGLVYRDLYQRHWWWRTREAFLLRYLRSHNLARSGHALDIGCGDGLLLDTLKELGCTPHGMEADDRLVSEETRKKHRIHIGILDSDFQPDQPYDLILMLDVLEHIEDDVQALQHVHRCLSPNGVLVITVPALPLLWTAHDDMNHHFRRYTGTTLKRVIDAAGLKTNVSRYFYNWLVPLKLMIRLKESVLGATSASPKVPGKFVNSLFAGISRLEHKVTSKIQLPVGTSLFAICKKAELA